MAKQATLDREIVRLQTMVSKRRRKLSEAEKKLHDATARAKHNAERKVARKRKAETKAVEQRNAGQGMDSTTANDSAVARAGSGS